MKINKMTRWMGLVGLVLLFGCNDKEPQGFNVKGTITNSTAKKVFLEEVPAGSAEGRVVDSFLLEKDGKYQLRTEMKEPMIYNLRLDRNQYPVASVLNDVPVLTLDIELNTNDNQFAKNYTVKGSPATQEMKDFMLSFNNDLEKIYSLNQQIISIVSTQGSDSAVAALSAQQKFIAGKIKDYSLNSKTNNPALALFELGYYQSTANSGRFGLEAIDIEQVMEILNAVHQKHPGHKGIKAVRDTLASNLARYQEPVQPPVSSWVGKPAPDFTLPDVNGKKVSLSSFKGKYVLVDFWASWCKPCRDENPNVVRAYNEFKDKNFTVLGVSLDRPGQKDKWLEAITADNLTWTHISDLKYWESSVIPLYGIEGIPFNVLVDPEGKVVAEDLKGPALAAKLREALK